jgi:uncharacterized protein
MMLYYEIDEKDIAEKLKIVSEKYNTDIENIKYKVIYIDESSSNIGVEIYENLLPKSVESIDSDITEKQQEDFKIEIDREGVFLTVLKKGVAFNKISEAIIEKDIFNSEYSKIEKAVNLLGNRIKICESEERMFAKPVIDIKTEDNGMKAFLKISKHGNVDILNKKDIYEELEKNGIIFGIDDLEIELILRNKIRDKFIKIAEGKEKTNGEDAIIIMNIEIISADKEFRAKQDEKGQMDFKTLNLFTMVKSGDLIATKISATEGNPGKTVYGEEILPFPGKDKILRTGKNTTTSDDGLKMVAEIDGMIVKEQDKISVMDIYKVGNVGIDTGNIEFNGSVIVTGDVLSGYSITATGNIEVNGNLELCHLKAGGDIVIKGGIAGHIQGKIDSKGGVTAKFAESVEIVAGGDITINEEIISCKIFCGGTLRTINKRGHIIGGEIVAAKGIEVTNIGSVYGVKTYVESGNNPLLVKAIEEREKEISELRKKLLDIEKTVLYLENKKEYAEYKFSEVEYEKLEALRKAKFSMSYYVAEAEVSLAEFKKDQEIAEVAEIKCSGVCYPGTVLKIKDKKYKVQEEIKTNTFYYEDNEIKHK